MKKRTQNSSTLQGQPARRKDDDEFKQQALTMGQHGQSVRSVAEALGISENLIHQWKRAARATQSAAELEIEQLRAWSCTLIEADSTSPPSFALFGTGLEEATSELTQNGMIAPRVRQFQAEQILPIDPRPNGIRGRSI